MRKTAMKRCLATLFAFLVLVGTGFVAATPAMAAEVTPNPDPLAFVAEPGAIDESNPALPEVREKIRQAGGGGVISTWKASFVPIDSTSSVPGSESTRAAAPTGCEIYGIIYFTQRWANRSSVYNDGNTYCPGAVGISMNLGILKQDTVWGTVTGVGYGNFRGNGPEVKGEVEYSCPTGNLSGFSATADGTLTRNGTLYGVSQKSKGFQRFDCG